MNKTRLASKYDYDQKRAVQCQGKCRVPCRVFKKRIRPILGYKLRGWRELSRGHWVIG